MTENCRLGDLELGHPGLLTYVPSENPELGPGLLHTARRTTGSKSDEVSRPSLALTLLQPYTLT